MNNRSGESLDFAAFGGLADDGPHGDRSKDGLDTSAVIGNYVVARAGRNPALLINKKISISIVKIELTAAATAARVTKTKIFENMFVTWLCFKL